MLLVTGAAGHLGNVFIRHLLERGEHGEQGIRAMILPGEDRSPLAGLDVDIVEADITRPEMLPAAFGGVTQVVHLASLVSIGDAQDKRVEHVNVGGTRNILDACRAAGVRRRLYVGSFHAFLASGRSLDESAPLALNAASAYERTKAAATRMVLGAASELDVVVVAPSGVFGPFDFKRSEVGTSVRNWVARPFTVMLPGGYDFVDVRDVAEGLRLALEKGRRGEVYLLSNDWIEMGGMAREVMNRVHGRSWMLTLPLSVSRKLAQVTLRDSQRRGVRPVLTPYALETMQATYRVDWSKAR